MGAGRSSTAAVPLGLAFALFVAGCATPIEIPGNADPNGPPYKMSDGGQTAGDAASAGLPDGLAIHDSAPAGEIGAGVIDGDGGTADAAGRDAQPVLDGGDARPADAAPLDGLPDLTAADAASANAPSGGNDV